MSQPQVTTLLLVEDDVVDVETVRRGLRKLRIANPLVLAKDGVEALAILRGTDGYERVERPVIILLDINLPRMSGLEFLEAVRADPKLRSLVVFVLTTSNDDQDRLRAYESNVAGYILKEKAGESFLSALDLVDHYWRVVELPTPP